MNDRIEKSDIDLLNDWTILIEGKQDQLLVSIVSNQDNSKNYVFTLTEKSNVTVYGNFGTVINSLLNKARNHKDE